MQALFIHGMCRTPLSGWRLVRRLKAGGIDAGTFGYATAVRDFAHISKQLASRIALLASNGDYILIGHSLGGVLLRAALALLPAGTRPPARVFLVGSPTRSVRLARLFRRNPVFRAITGDCGQLLASDERMNNVAPLTVPTTAIFGVRGVPVTFRAFQGEPNDGIVAVSEASALWIADQVQVPVEHWFLPASRRIADIILDRMGEHA